MSISPRQPLETFSLFPELPPELRFEILRHCSRNDLVCLSLTGPAMRSFVAPLITSKPQLTWVDQLEPATQLPSKCICSPSGIRRHSTCKGAGGNEIIYDPQSNRYRRHFFKGTRVCYQCRPYPSEHPTCQVPGCKRHCSCISCPLFLRLRGWMGNDRRYCGQCQKFTTRTRKNKNRCTHGKIKVRKTPDNHWSRKRGLSYGNRWWRKWGTHGIDHEAYQPDAALRRNARVV